MIHGEGYTSSHQGEVVDYLQFSCYVKLMPIRLRAIHAIIITNLLIILFSVSAGIVFVRNNIRKSQETDLLVVADIADHFISSEIEILKLQASMLVHILTESEEKEWPTILAIQEAENPQFIGMSVLDANSEIITSIGDLPATAEVIEDKYIKQAFLGKTTISSTLPSSIGMVFYLAAPLPSPAADSHNRIFVLTLPGMYFSQRVSTFVIWQSGHIFIDDEEGHVIANIRENWIQSRYNFIKLAETDGQYEETALIIRRVISGETGTGYFTLSGVPRLCAFKPVTASEEGWCLGIVAPLPESPFRNIDKGLLVVGFVAVLLSIIAAIIASNFIKKPFEEVAALKEAAEANSRYKSTFLANMSHEMRTPLNVVVGLTDLRMEDEKLPAKVKEDLKKINSAGELLLGIVNDVLDISKIEAGKLELSPVDYEIASLLNDIIILNVIRIESKPVKFKVDISEDLPCELNGDELRVKQIFNNLLSNAFKYTKEGTVTLNVGCTRIDEKNIVLSATIKDTGIGIRQEDIKKLFSDYNQVDIKANRRIEGTGLGLSITKKLVEMMNGEITVESVYGVGTSFSVKMTQGIVTEKTLGVEMVKNLGNFQYTDQKKRASKELIRPDLSYARVLVVDDMQTNLDVATGLMRKYKMQVDCVGSGEAAINLIKRGHPVFDAIFMDHMMPEMDGVEATRLIRNLDSEYARTVPIISLTANALVGNEQMFLEKGFNAFLSKPINILKLDSIIRKWIRKKNLDEEKIPGAKPVAKKLKKNKQEVSKMYVSKIPGVNMEVGLDLYGGEMDIYVSVLESFATNTPEAINKMRNVTKEGLPDYAIVAHGLKSVCGTIAAGDISERAKKLEAMSKAGDITGVLADNDKFIEDAQTLVQNVKNWLKTSAR